MSKTPLFEKVPINQCIKALQLPPYSVPERLSVLNPLTKTAHDHRICGRCSVDDDSSGDGKKMFLLHQSDRVLG